MSDETESVTTSLGRFSRDHSIEYSPRESGDGNNLRSDEEQGDLMFADFAGTKGGSPRSVFKSSVGQPVNVRLAQSIRSYWASCSTDLQRVIDDDDEIAKANSWSQFDAHLKDLWSIRSRREEGFGDIVNTLQQLVFNRDHSYFLVKHLECMRDACARLEHEPVYDDIIVNDLHSEFVRAGLDVFRCLD